MIVVQTFNRPGWPSNSTMELDDHAGAALLTAARDYEAEKHVNLHGDYAAAPVGCDRTIAEVVEMRAAWRAPRSSALWLTIGRDKYNMDPRSTAIPSLTSQHLSGLCVDISDNGFLAWLIVNGKRYGLVRTLVKENDLRHFQFFPGTATAALDVTSLDNASTIKPEDPDMPKVMTRNNGTAASPAWVYALFDGEHWEETSDPTVAGIWAQLYNDGNSIRDITGNTGALAAWNYRSNSRPDLKVPFGATSGGSGGFTATDRTTLQAIPNATAVGDALTSQASLIIAKIPTKAILTP